MDFTSRFIGFCWNRYEQRPSNKSTFFFCFMVCVDTDHEAGIKLSGDSDFAIKLFDQHIHYRNHHQC